MIQYEPSKLVVKLCFLIAILPAAVFGADAVNISGTWNASFDTQIGKQEYTYTFVVKGSQLTGHAKSAIADTEITEGKVDGSKVSFRTGVPGNRSRTRCCCRMMILAVVSLTGRRRPSRAFLWLS